MKQKKADPWCFLVSHTLPAYQDLYWSVIWREAVPSFPSCYQLLFLISQQVFSIFLVSLLIAFCSFGIEVMGV